MTKFHGHRVTKLPSFSRRDADADDDDSDIDDD